MVVATSTDEKHMYRIRFHGRGGQGMKTASRILGTAFFLEGFEVQDAPRYGAERRGAPIFAYVRAAHEEIHERGVIQRPDLVVVADESLVGIPPAGVLEGVTKNTVLLISSTEPSKTWMGRLEFAGSLLTLPDTTSPSDPLELRFIGVTCTGAAARLVGVIRRTTLEQAIREELHSLGDNIVAANLEKALQAYDHMEDFQGKVIEGKPLSAQEYRPPEWSDLSYDDPRIASPTIHRPATSVEVKTGLWRTTRPVIDYDRCNRCWWVCCTLCPDGSLSLGEDGYPHIDYDHCKGCMICLTECTSNAIGAIPEGGAKGQEESLGRGV